MGIIQAITANPLRTATLAGASVVAAAVLAGCSDTSQAEIDAADWNGEVEPPGPWNDYTAFGDGPNKEDWSITLDPPGPYNRIDIDGRGTGATPPTARIHFEGHQTVKLTDLEGRTNGGWRVKVDVPAAGDYRVESWKDGDGYAGKLDVSAGFDPNFYLRQTREGAWQIRVDRGIDTRITTTKGERPSPQQAMAIVTALYQKSVNDAADEAAAEARANSSTFDDDE
jgi:hypothetical protein